MSTKELVFDASLGGVLKLSSHFHKDINPVTYASLALEYGDLTDGELSSIRFKNVKKMLDNGRFEGSDALELDKNANTWQDFLNMLDEKDHVRIWLNRSTNDICMFYYAVTCLKSICKISVIDIDSPKIPIGESLRTDYINDNYDSFIAIEHELTKAEIDNITLEWKSALSSHLPLRMLINGRLVQAPSNAFDALIETHLPEGEFTEGKATVLVLRALGLSMDPLFIEWRLSEILYNGKYEVTGKKPRHDFEPYESDYYYNIYKRKEQ